MLDKTALIIFAREPKDGKTKTRLLKALPVKTVTQIYKKFVKHILNMVKSVKCTEKFIYYVGTGASIPFLRQFEKYFILKRQMGKDLGIRMHRAFTHCAKHKFTKIIIIGTDCLTLTDHDIQKAFDKLTTFDCVLGPANDGGYYLIGLKAPEKELFGGITWSSNLVLDQTVKKLNQLNKSYYLLREQEDIDTIESLKNQHYIKIPNERLKKK